MRVRIVAPCRAHLGLIGLSRHSSRGYGGAGVALWHQSTVVEIESRSEPRIEIEGVDDDSRRHIENLLASADIGRVRVSVVRRVPPHVGLGSKTALLLACVEGAMVVSGMPAPPMEVVRIAGRGGASGVGVNTYFSGGIVADMGHSMRSIRSFAPSGRRVGFFPPAPLYRFDFPAAWSIALILPRAGQGLHSFAESRFFSSNTELDRSECASVAMALTFELPAAIAECDIHACAEAFRWSRSTGFKARELLSQPATRELLYQLDPLPGVATTMSSMGPAIVVIADDPSALAPVRELAHPDNGWDIVTGTAANTGRRISASP